MECIICGGKEPSQPEFRVYMQRGDSLSEKLPEIELYFTCHRNCISTYCSKHHIEQYLRKHERHVLFLQALKN